MSQCAQSSSVITVGFIGTPVEGGAVAVHLISLVAGSSHGQPDLHGSVRAEPSFASFLAATRIRNQRFRILLFFSL